MQKKSQNDWFDVAMIEPGSLTLDPNDDPSTQDWESPSSFLD